VIEPSIVTAGQGIFLALRWYHPNPIALMPYRVRAVALPFLNYRNLRSSAFVLDRAMTLFGE